MLIEEPGYQALTIPKGTNYVYEFTIEVDDVLLDLSDAEIYSQIRNSKSQHGDIIVPFTVLVDDVEVPNAAPTTMVVKLTLDADDTVDLDDNNGFYDVLVIQGGVSTYYLEGPVLFKDTVSRST